MKIIKANNQIENWKKEIQSEDRKIALNAADNLVKKGGDNIAEFLIELLDSKIARIRNVASISIRETKDNRAIEPLLKAIFKSENRNYNGTMVYALETLDCKNKLVEIFKILFYESYESKIAACAILDEQTFEFSREDLLEIRRMWSACINKPIMTNGFENNETRLMMKDAYEGFMEYLEEENKPSSDNL